MTESGELSCWGRTGGGPARVPAGRYQALSVGGAHACALSEAGAIDCWDRNNVGQTEAPEGRFIQLSAGRDHSCAVREDAALVCWGGDLFYGTPLARDYVAPLGSETDDLLSATVLEPLEARIVARLLSNGSIEFGLQPEGEERILPQSRFFPTSARIDRWLVSSDVDYQGELLGRITARLLESGQVEFAFVAPNGERILPDSRFFPTGARVDRWLRSSPLDLDRQ